MVINFKSVVLPELIGYAELVVNREILRRSWEDGNRNETSVISLDELFTQFFDGAHAKHVLREVANLLPDDTSLRASIVRFIYSMEETSNCVDDGSLQGNSSILDTDQWETLARFAGLFLEDAKEAGYSSEDFNRSEG